MRGCWLEGPMKRPLKRKLKDGVVVPESEHGFEQVRPTEEGRVFRRSAAHDDMVAAAGADMAAIQHEFFRGETGFACDFVKLAGALHHFPPAFGGVGC